MVRLAAVVGEVADADAPLAFHVAGALAADALLLAAGAHGHADVALVLLQPVGQVLDRQRLALGRDGLLDRDNMHADAGTSGRHHLGDARQRQIRHALEEVCRLREHIRLLGIDHHDLGTAGDEHVQHPAFLMVRVLAVEVLPVELDQTALADSLHRFFQIGSVELRVFLCELLDRERHALFHRQGDIEDIVRHLLIILHRRELQGGVDAQILRGIRRDLVLAEQGRCAIRDFFAELCNLLVFCHVLASFSDSLHPNNDWPFGHLNSFQRRHVNLLTLQCQGLQGIFETSHKKVVKELQIKSYVC